MDQFMVSHNEIIKLFEKNSLKILNLLSLLNLLKKEHIKLKIKL